MVKIVHSPDGERVVRLSADDVVYEALRMVRGDAVRAFVTLPSQVARAISNLEWGARIIVMTN